MRKILIIIFLFAFVGAFGQTNDTTKYFKSIDYGWQYKRLKIDSIIVLPNGVVVNRAYRFLSASDTASMLAPYAKITSIPSLTPYMKYTDSAAMLSAYYNKTAVNALQSLNVKYLDTASMLTPYAKTANVISSATVVKYTDTASLLSPYLRSANAAATYYLQSNPSAYITASAISVKVNVSDTASMLSPYARTSNLPSIAGKVNYSDTASMLSPYQRSYNAVKYTDTASMLSNYRTQINTNTSVIATNTSNITANTNSINSLISDSVYQAAQIALKVNISDTSNMLSAYYNKTAANALLATKQSVLTNPVTGTGTLNYHVKFTATGSTIGNSLIYDNATSVGINTATPSASAALQISSTTQGILFPVMTASQRTAIVTPANGLIVVQLDGAVGLYIYISSAWHAIVML